ncbi:MAG TPA: ATP-binding cassette domain-containing protein [Polyangiaceae bacterium]|nr:ATP-binding cassette domain-containing protein [Polyangiaceae bacterium]
MPSSPHTSNDALVDVRDATVGVADETVLEHASFQVRAGDIFAVLGRSGSGKSVLLRHLIGLEVPKDGVILVEGEPPTRSAHGLPRYGVTFQSGALFGSMSIGDNVALPLERWTRFGRDVIAIIVRSKLRVVGLEGAEPKLPSELSGGMKTRAAIARAMALDPPLLFLDEPTSGLDPVSRDGIDDLLLELNRQLGLTVVLVSHELESVFRIASRCVLLDRESRRIIAQGDPRELRGRSDDARVRRFLGHAAPPEG